MNDIIKEAENNREIQIIVSAIYKVTGIKLVDIAVKSRKRDLFFARLIFVKYCQDKIKMIPVDILDIVDREPSMIYYYQRKYNDEICYNSEFRRIVQEVDRHLKELIPA